MVASYPIRMIGANCRGGRWPPGTANKEGFIRGPSYIVWSSSPLVEDYVLFHFELRSFRDVTPYAAVSPDDAKRADWERRPHVDWYMLTDGWYWIDAGGVELLR